MAAGVVTYTYPVSGTVAPTAAQVQGLSMVTATLNMGDTDTTSALTHNFQLSLAEGTQLFPIVIVTVASAGTANASFAVVLTNSVSIAVNKLSATGSGGTYNVYILRPHTGIR